MHQGVSKTSESFSLHCGERVLRT